MLNRITLGRPLLRHSLANYRLLNTSRAVKNPSLGMSATSQNSSLVSHPVSSYSSSTAPAAAATESAAPSPKKWARHVISTKPQLDSNETEKKVSSEKPKRRKRRTLKPLKAPITLTENAKAHLRALSMGPNPKLIRISVRNRGCSGLTYHLEYVGKPEKFDEIVEQDDIKVVIDSKALFSIIGSEMDWVDNKLSSKFVFKNPNSKGTCGCGESFMV